MRKVIRSFLAMLSVMAMVLGECPVGAGIVPELSKVEAASALPTVNEAEVRARVTELARILEVKNGWGMQFTVNGGQCPSKHSISKSNGCTNCKIGNIMMSGTFLNKFKFQVQNANLLPVHYSAAVQNGKLVKGNTCVGFANFALWYIARENNSSDVYNKYIGSTQIQPFNESTLRNSDIRIGDVIALSKDGKNHYHSAMFIDYVDGGIKVLDSNYVSDPQKVNRVQIHTISYTKVNYVSITRAANYVPDAPGAQQHVCSAAPVAAREATCTSAGNKAYYVCASCGKWYWDSGCTSQITDKNAVTIAAKGHNFGGRPSYIDGGKHAYSCANGCGAKQEAAHKGKPVAAKAATCTTAGNIAYYVCDCGAWFADSACQKVITDSNAVVVAAKGHNFSGKPSYVDGGKHAYSCVNGCGAKQEEAHKGKLVAAKAATCTTAGNIAYYVCDCGAWFADSACQKVITDSNAVVVAAKGHNFSGKATYIDYTAHSVVCANGCGEKRNEAHKDTDGDKFCDLCSGDTVAPEKRGLHVTLKNPGTQYVYTGSAVTPDIIVANDGEVLTPGVDYTVKYSNNINASVEKAEKNKPRITVTGKKNLTGSTYTTFDIQPKDIGDSDVVAGNLIVSEGAQAVPTLIYRGTKLTSKDYTVEDARKKYMKDGVLQLAGKGNYTGSRQIPVKVVQKNALKKFNVTLGPERLTYNGREQRQSFTVADTATKQVLTEGTDYRVIWPANLTDAGTVRFSVTGMGDYAGTVTKSYTIRPLVVRQGMRVTGVNPNGYAYSSKGVTIGGDLEVTCDNGAGTMKLTEGRDYRISYSGNKKVSTAASPARFTVSFIGNYRGSTALKGAFTIYASNLGKTSPDLKVIVADKIYTGRAGEYKSEPYITVKGTLLKRSDYTVKYYRDAAMTQEIKGRTNNIALSSDEPYATVYVRIALRENYASVNGAKGFVTASYRVCNKTVFKDLSKARVTFLDDSGAKLKKAEYTGRTVTPKVKVELKMGRNYVEVPSDQYRVVYVNNVNKGTATAIIIGTDGAYGGSKTATFKIAARNVKNLADFWNVIFRASK